MFFAVLLETTDTTLLRYKAFKNTANQTRFTEANPLNIHHIEKSSFFYLFILGLLNDAYKFTDYKMSSDNKQNNGE